MEKVSIEFSDDEITKIEKFRLENETLESTVRRLVLSHLSEISNEEWVKNQDEIFNEFEETFQKLAE